MIVRTGRPAALAAPIEPQALRERDGPISASVNEKERYSDPGQVQFRRERVEESARVFGQRVDEVIDLVGITIVDQ